MTVRNSKIATTVWTALLVLTISCGHLYATPLSSVSKSASARNSDDDCEYRYQDGSYGWYPEGCDDEFPISTGWIIVIAIVSLILTFGVPIGICFCFGCLCFKAFKRRKNPRAPVYDQQPGPQPQGYPAGTYPQQQGYPAGTYPQQQGYPAGTYPQQQGYPAGTYPQQQGYPAGSNPQQQGYPAGTYPQQQGYPAGSNPQKQGYPAASYPQQQPDDAVGSYDTFFIGKPSRDTGTVGNR